MSIGADITAMQTAFAAACRRAALSSLALAAAAYQPGSYDDAAEKRTAIAAAFDEEITRAGDAGEDDAYTALKALRAAVIANLTNRGGLQPRTATVTFRAALPALLIAQMLYKDASRSDEIVREANPPHPAFCPTSFRALVS